MRSSTGVVEVEAILEAVRENRRRGRKPGRLLRGSIEGSEFLETRLGFANDKRNVVCTACAKGVWSGDGLMDENRGTAIGRRWRVTVLGMVRRATVSIVVRHAIQWLLLLFPSPWLSDRRFPDLSPGQTAETWI